MNPAPTSATELEPALLRFDTLPTVEPRERGPLWRTSWRSLGPHVGAVYRLANEVGREMTLRGGWDLVYDELTSPDGVAIGGGAPYVSIRLFAPTVLPCSPDALSAGAPVDDLATRYAFDDLQSPRTYRWHLGFDRALGGVQRLSVAYVGAAGRDLVYRFAYYPGGTGTIYAFSNEATSDYHALVTEYTRRLSRGLQGRVTWT